MRGMCLIDLFNEFVETNNVNT